MRKSIRNNLAITGLALLAATIAFYFMPVTFTAFENPQDETLSPFGEVMPGNPLTQCASDIGNFGRYGEIKLKLLLATYNRLNTGHYTLEVFVLDGGNKVVLYREIFNAGDTRDNKYRPFGFTPASTIPGRLCFSLSGADSAPGNALTIWLNSHSDPVYKITAQASLPELLTRLGNQNLFGLGRDTLFGLFFAYLFVQMWLILYLAATIIERKTLERPSHEPEKNSKPANRKRTGKSRV